MMGERSSPFISGITVLLICVQLLCFSASQSTTCTMPSVKEGQTTTLTVEFGFNLQDEEHHRDVIIKRLRGTTGETEDLLDCYWEKCIKDYRCKMMNPRFYFSNHITENTTLVLPNASKEDEGNYFIDVTDTERNSCSFSLGDGDSGADVNTTTLIRPDENTATLTVVTVVMVVSLLLNLAVGIHYLTKRWGKWSTCKHGVNSALARMLPCWLIEEAKEPVQATDLGEKDSKDGEEENPEGEDATETDNLHELLDVRG